MNWQVVAASAIGTSHVATGDDCQDSYLAHVERFQNQPPLLSIFVADGAGSAARGGEGAKLAIKASETFITRTYELPEFAMNHKFAVECVIAVRERISAQAEKEGFKMHDYACTFLGVLSSSQGTLVMQIGDGGIVLDVGQGLNVPVVPMSGMYANMTNFVTDEDAVDVLVSKFFSNKASKVAVFTDGIQRLALNMANNTAHEPFFEPFFRVLSTTNSEQEDRLKSALADFLNSEPVNKRTDDDKTLALAVLVD